MTHTTYRVAGIALVGAVLATFFLATAISSDAGTGEVESCFRKAVTGTVGTPGDDVIRLTDGSDTIDAMGGNDRICGRQGDDIIFAGEGNDRVRAGQGRDRVDGGDGSDVIRGNAGDDGTVSIPTARAARGTSPGLFGNAGDDEIAGGTGSDLLEGGENTDHHDGGQGFDGCYDGGDPNTFERCEDFGNF